MAGHELLALLARYSARLSGRIGKIQSFSNTAREAFVQLKTSRDYIETIGLLTQGISSPRNQMRLPGLVIDANVAFRNGFSELEKVTNAIQNDFSGYFKRFLETQAPWLSQNEKALAAINAEKTIFENNMGIIKAHQKSKSALDDAYYRVADAVREGRYAELPELVEKSLKEMDEVLNATEEAIAAFERAVAVLEREAAVIGAIVAGGAGATTIALTPAQVQAAEDLVDDLEFRLKVDCQLEIEARRREPSLGQKVWENLKEGPDTGMMGLSPEVLDWSGAGAMTEVGIAGYRYANTPNQPKCDDPIPQAITQAEISRMRANVEAAWKTLEQQQIAKEQSPPANQPAAAESTPKFSLGAARG